MNCINSNSTFSRCSSTLSSECVIYQGNPVQCLSICTGDTITQVEQAILDQLCVLTGLIDLNDLIIPACLISAFSTKDKNLFNSIQILLDSVCQNTTDIDTLEANLDTLDPLVDVDFRCCSNNPCVTTGVVRLSVALENILSCLCTQADLVASLQAQLASYQTQINSLTTQYQNLTNAIYGVAGVGGIQRQLNDFCVVVTGSTSSTDTNGLVGRVDCIKNGVASASSFPINVNAC